MSEVKIAGTIEATSIVHKVGNTTVEIKPGRVIIQVESQLDRIERKMDSILSQLEDKELSINLDGKEIAKVSYPLIKEIAERENRTLESFK